MASTRREVLRALAAGALAAPWAAGRAAAPLEVRVTDAQGRPLPDAVAFVESRDAREQVQPLSGAEIAQKDRRFVPSVLVVTVGTAVAFPNLDTVRHHVYSFSPIKRFEIKLYVGTPASPVVFDKPGIAVLGCNIHDQMAAWVVVVDTPWFGRTDAEGRWTGSVPAGRHTLRVWHPELPAGTAPQDQPIVVDAAGTRASVRLAGLVR